MDKLILSRDKKRVNFLFYPSNKPLNAPNIAYFIKITDTRVENVL